TVSRPQADRLRVNLLVNTFRADAMSAARKAIEWLIRNKVDVSADHESAQGLDVPEVAPEAFSDADMILAIGGDGTLIRAAYLVSERGTPIMGVHYGRFGFVTQVQPKDTEKVL